MNRRTVKDIVKLVGPLPFKIVGRWAIQICNGIKNTPEQDTTNGFIPLTTDVLKVTDDLNIETTSLVFRSDSEPLDNGKTFFSPERAKGDPPDNLTTLYLLGMVLYELTTGQEPFTATSQADLLLAHMRVTPPGVRSIRFSAPDSLATVIERLLKKSPQERFSSTNEVIEIISKMSFDEDETGKNAQKVINELFGGTKKEQSPPLKVHTFSSPKGLSSTNESDPEANRATLRMKVPVFSGPPSWEKNLSLTVHTGKAVFSWNTEEARAYTCKVAITQTGRTVFHITEEVPVKTHEITAPGLTPGTGYTASIYGETEFVMRKFKTPVSMV